MLEHPAFIEGLHVPKGGASIWRLPELLRLLALPIADLHCVKQKDFGMRATKPTFFGSSRLDIFIRRLAEFRAPTPPSQLQSLSGRNDDGSFRIAIGKEYPSALCRAIAFTFGYFGQQAEQTAVASRGCVEAPAFSDLVKPFLVSIAQSAADFGDDFVDHGALPLLRLPNVRPNA